MIVEVRVPRINNNDDDVRVARLWTAAGDDVTSGQLVAEVETDKATVTLESSKAGRVLGISGRVGEMMRVGSVLLWIGTEPGDALRESPAGAGTSPTTDQTGPTAKARDLLTRHGLRAEDIPVQGERMIAQDVERVVAARLAETPASRESRTELPAGRLEPLSPQERAMWRAVLWHRHEAVPAYVKYAYDDRAWREHAQAFAEQHRLLLSPLLGLMAHRLAAIARNHPKLNSTLTDDQRWQYTDVNVGFTVQAREILYLVVVRDAGPLTAIQFVNALTSLQRAALAHKLAPEHLRGATIGFTSMEKWGLSRHMPILPAHVSLMIAHSVDTKGQALLGATYDHRVLNGGEVALALKQLSEPGTEDASR